MLNSCAKQAKTNYSQLSLVSHSFAQFSAQNHAKFAVKMAEFEDYSTESTEFQNLDPDDVEMREAYEENAIYDIWQVQEEKAIVFSQDPSDLLPVDKGLAR